MVDTHTTQIMTNEEIIQSVKLSVNIVDYARDYTDLTYKAYTGGGDEYAGPCPVCGGTDRFVVNSKLGWFCRFCQGDEHFMDVIALAMFIHEISFIEALRHLVNDENVTLIPRELERRKAAAEARAAKEEEEKKKKQAVAMTALNRSGHAEKYHRLCMSKEKALALWQKRGLPKEYVELWGLGYAEREWAVGHGEYKRLASLTIPHYYPINGEQTLMTMQHRLFNPPDGFGRYRFDRPNLPPCPFIANRTKPILDFNTVIFVEGAIKAMVLQSALWMPNVHRDEIHMTLDEIQETALADDYLVIGIPTMINAATVGRFRSALDDYQTVFIIADPGEREAQGAIDSVKILGARRAKYTMTHLAEKIDDAINHSQWPHEYAKTVLKSACRRYIE